MSTAKKVATAKPLATTAAKPAKKGKTPKETATKSKVVGPKIYVQYSGQEISYEEIIEKVKGEWVFEGNKVSQIETLNIYVKPEEESIYYVINEEVTGRIVM